ncbi:ankyrin repeat domain-containing protein 27-like [Clytia hemisphaerica]|uniref:VPS9 domain-containing protein n=1 Tax=Clytia hemisphaerica TaxID=252671 RepID=A0A7M5V7S3_9CNID
MDDYDEDLQLNPFFKALTTKGKQIYQKATEERRTICIPRKGTTSRSHHNKQNFETYVLRQEQEDSDVYITNNGKEVKINGKFIVTIKGFNEVKSIQILFEETFYNKDDKSYHVLCINQPLVGTASTSSLQPVIANLETLDNCINFLWTGHGRKTRQQINELIHLFNSTYTRLANESIRHTMDATNTVFSKAMQLCLKESHLRKPAMANKMFMDNLKVAVETYVMDGVYEKVFKGISSFLVEEDASLNKTTRNLADLQLKDLGVNVAMSKNIPKAKKILAKINVFHTPLEKFYILKFTITALSEANKYSKDEESIPITADDLLPALVFLIVKTDIPNWLANLAYLTNFHFSRSKSDEFQFYLSSTEAAIEHVRNGRLDSLISMTHNQRLKMASSLFQRFDSSTEKQTGPSPVEIFFEKIRSNETEEVMKMLQKSARKMKDISESLCHPLCSCDKCEKLMTSKCSDPSAVTVFSRDELGCTCLHQAAEFGAENLIYDLIKKGAVVNATNYLGSTPLHYACQRGHQKVAVLLTHYDADPNIVDNAGNSPLHLAIENCHEIVADFLCSEDCEKSCKKKLEIDVQNEHGDSPLHIASRWGFRRLVYLLLKCGASKDLKNKKHENPMECAMNNKVREIFLRDTNDESKEDGYVYLPPSPDSERRIAEESSLKTGVIPPDSPSTSRKRKEVTTLLKAAANGDEATVRTKLGLPQKSTQPIESSGAITSGETVYEDLNNVDISAQLCHPLCQCERCCLLQQKFVNETVTLSANMCNSDGVSALHVASLHGNENIVKLLVGKASADPNVKTKTNCRTPLHLACQYNNIECVNILLKNGSRTNLKDNTGNTALHFTCSNGHVGPAILLLQSGADVNCTNQRGNTPLHDAARWNFVDICGLLLHYGAPLDVNNKLGMSPLQYTSNEEARDLLQKAVNDLHEKEAEEKNHSSTKKQGAKVDFTDEQDPSLFKDQSLVATSSPNPHTTPTSRDQAAVTSQNPVMAISGNASTGRPKLDKKEMFARKNTVNDLFAALEHHDIVMLRQVADGIKSFDRRKSLRRASTLDKSSLWLTSHKTMMSIQSFDQTNLRTPFSERQKSTSFSSDVTTNSDHSSSIFDENESENTSCHDDSKDLSLLSKIADNLSRVPKEMNDLSRLPDQTDGLSRSPTKIGDLPRLPKPTGNVQLLSAGEDYKENNITQDPSGDESRDGFDDWFEKDLHSESADEEFEENLVIIDVENEPCDQADGCYGIQQNHPDSDLIPELLSEAIQDVGDDVRPSRPRLVSRNSIEETLKKDNHFFEGEPAPSSPQQDFE